MWAEFKWAVENFGNILLMGLCLLMVLGWAIELVTRLIPTSTPDSMLTIIGLKMGRFGAYLVKIGMFAKTVLDFIKFPNNLKK